jgi:hypothetical protein
VVLRISEGGSHCGSHQRQPEVHLGTTDHKARPLNVPMFCELRSIQSSHCHPPDLLTRQIIRRGTTECHIDDATDSNRTLLDGAHTVSCWSLYTSTFSKSRYKPGQIHDLHRRPFRRRPGRSLRRRRLIQRDRRNSRSFQFYK